MSRTLRYILVASLAGCFASVDAAAGSLNLLAFGDSGTGEKPQKRLAAVMAKTCESLGCDAALLLGDNIYPDGVQSVRDRQFQDKFEKPYADLNFPFYVVLGNHDVHLGPAGAEAQVAYSAHSQKWRMPARYYRQALGDTELFALDTNSILDEVAQQRWLEDALASSRARWKIVFGHHPVYSVGGHGRDDAEDGHPQARLRAWLSPLLCRYQALYLSGHEHLLQLSQLPCGSLSVVSGAAAKPRAADDETVRAQRDTLRFHRAEALGFVHLAVRDEAVEITFWGEAGQLLHEVSYTGHRAP